MGNASSATSKTRRNHYSQHISNTSTDQRKGDADVIKLLLLGTAEGGKSIVMKQMKIPHCDGFTEEDRMALRITIYSNIVSGMKTVIDAMDERSIRFKSSVREADSFIIVREAAMLATPRNWAVSPFNRYVLRALRNLWLDAGIQESFKRGNEYNLLDSFEYFMEELDRIFSTGYRPTQQDMLRCRAATTGIVELSYRLRAFTFRVFDVGGQRSQRRKWLHCFEDANAIIFVVGVSEFDQNLSEDNEKNRLRESQSVFQSIVNNKYFNGTDFVLFLNKKDLFRRKLERSKITRAFPDYTGPQTYEDCMRYIAERFLGVVERSNGRQLFLHRTCSTDTNQVQLILTNCLNTIMANMLMSVGV